MLFNDVCELCYLDSENFIFYYLNKCWVLVMFVIVGGVFGLGFYMNGEVVRYVVWVVWEISECIEKRLF